MSKSALGVTAEDIRGRFLEVLQKLPAGPSITLLSVEPSPNVGFFRIKSADPYGALPDCCVFDVDGTDVSRLTIEAAVITHRIAEIRREIQEHLPGGRFLVPFPFVKGPAIAGVFGIPGKGLVIATADTILEAYEALRLKLDPWSGSLRVAEVIVATLGMLPALYFAIDDADLPTDKAAFPAPAIAATVRATLRSAGVRVVDSEAELWGIPGGAVLSARLNVCKATENVLAVSSRLELWQMVAPAHKTALRTFGITWCTPTRIKASRADQVNEAIFEEIRKLTDFFIDSYRVADGMEKGAGRDWTFPWFEK